MKKIIMKKTTYRKLFEDNDVTTPLSKKYNNSDNLFEEDDSEEKDEQPSDELGSSEKKQKVDTKKLEQAADAEESNVDIAGIEKNVRPLVQFVGDDPKDETITMDYKDDNTSSTADNFNDDDEITVDTGDISYIEKDKNATLKVYALLSSNRTNEILAAIKLFDIKMTLNFYDNVHFPQAPTQLKSLMCATKMPKKFQNIYASYDDNPLVTIEKALDKAETYFGSLNTVSESLNFDNYNVLNELKDTVQMMGNGLKAGASISKGVAVGSAVGLSFLGGLVPGIAVIQTMGALSVGNENFGGGVKDDRELHKKYSEDVKKLESKQQVIYASIDNYVNTVLLTLITGLQHITAGSNAAGSEIRKLLKLVINSLTSKSQDELTTFIESHNEDLKKNKEESIKKLRELKRNNEYTFTDILKKLERVGEDPSQLDIKKLIKIIEKALDKNDSAGVEEFVQYNYKKSLNEAENADTKKIEFDADSLYETLNANIRDIMSAILNSDPELWTIISTARKQMEALKEGANKEITNAIEQICRTANNGSMGLSSKLMGFVSKHPMRAGRLLNLWTRHMGDLDMRIQLRIKQISEGDGKGPFAMAREFYTQTIPALFASMIVYKTLLRMCNNKALIDPSIALYAKQSGEDLNKAALQELLSFMQLISACLLGNIKKLQADNTSSESNNTQQDNTSDNNQDNSAANTTDNNQLQQPEENNVNDSLYINYTNILNEAKNVNNDIDLKSLVYLTPWLLAVNKSTDIKECISKSIELKSLNSWNSFISRIVDYILEDNNNCTKISCFEAINKGFEQMNKDDATSLVTAVQNNTDAFKTLPNNNILPLIIFYIKETNGNILIAYNEAKQKGELNVTNIKNILGIDNIEVKEDNINNNFGEITQYFENIIEDNNVNIDNLCNAYYDLKLNDINNEQLNVFNTINYLVQICNDPNVKSALSEQLNNVDFETLSNAYKSFISDNKKENYVNLCNSLSTDNKDLEVPFTDDAYNTFVNKFIELCKAKDGALPNNKDIQKPSITFKNLLDKELVAENSKEKPNGVNNIDELLTIDNSDKIIWLPNGIKALKEIMVYLIQYAKIDVEKNMDVEQTFIKWCESENISNNDVNLSFIQLINNWKMFLEPTTKYENGQRSIFEALLKNADATLNDKTTVNISLLDNLCNNSNLIKNGIEILEIIKSLFGEKGDLESYILSIPKIFTNDNNSIYKFIELAVSLAVNSQKKES